MRSRVPPVRFVPEFVNGFAFVPVDHFAAVRKKRLFCTRCAHAMPWRACAVDRVVVIKDDVRHYVVCKAPCHHRIVECKVVDAADSLNTLPRDVEAHGGESSTNVVPDCLPGFNVMFCALEVASDPALLQYALVDCWRHC